MARYAWSCAICLLAACGGDAPVEVTLHVLNGATTNVAGAGGGGDGDWILSPDQVRLRVEGLRFLDADGAWSDAGELIDCTATYDRSAPTLSGRVDCVFEMAAGTYRGVIVSVDPTLDLLVDDADHGLFTDGTGLVRAAPAGGARFTSVTGDAESGAHLGMFTEPLVVEATSTELWVALGGLHATVATVSGATASLESTALTVYATTRRPMAAEHYTTASTGLSINVTDVPTELVVYYEDPTTPVYAHITPGTADTCASDGYPQEAWNASPVPGVFDNVGGYLGLDDTGTLCWALPLGLSFEQYHAVYRVPRATAVGEAVTVSCEPESDAPAPVSGATYASGCPTLSTARDFSLTLVAD